MNIQNLLSIKTARSVFLGIAAAFFIMLILSFIAAIIIYNSKMLDSSLFAAAIVIESLAVFGGGYLAARLNGSRGLVIGLTCGLLVFALMLLFGVDKDISVPLKLLYCSVAGMAGGFLGIK